VEDNILKTKTGQELKEFESTDSSVPCAVYTRRPVANKQKLNRRHNGILTNAIQISVEAL
jgi:hypothetical protein